MLLLYFCLSFYMLFNTIIITGILVGKTLDDLVNARKTNVQMTEVRFKNDLHVIQLEINKK